jgi:hypothetical protein
LQVSKARLATLGLGAALVVVASLTLLVGRGLPASSSPSVLPGDVAIGSEVSCDESSMAAHCAIWIAQAREAHSVAAGDISSTEVHVAWSTPPRVGGYPIVVVVFKLQNGSTIYEPIWCGAGAAPTDPVCDMAGVSLPPS